MGTHTMAFKRTGILFVFGLALAVSAGTAFAHEASSQSSAQGLTQRLHNLHARYQQSDPSTQPQSLESLKLIAKSRKEILAALMETDPGAVLRQAVPASVRASLPADVQADVEEGTDLEGVLEILHEDWPGGGRFWHFLDTPTGRFSLHFAGELPDLLTGDHVRVSGIRIEKALALDASGPAAVQTLSAALPNTFGVQKTVMLLVNFQDEPIQPYTTAFAKSMLLTTTSGFYQENSYGQTSLTGDVFGWYTLPMSKTVCDYSTLSTLARSAAAAAGVNLSAYTRYVYAFPDNMCGWWGLGSVGGNPSQAWINGSLQLRVLGHEMGHNFGLYHSHAMDCGTAVVGPSCLTSEYGDFADIMGGSAYHFNAFQKWRLGWLGYNVSPPVTTVQGSGTYTIDAYETPGINPKALKIPRGTTGSTFYLEARRGTGFDSGMSASVTSGVVVHQASDSAPNSSYLLDMNAATSNWSAFPLQVGESFTDPYSPVTMTLLSSSSTGAVVNVSVGSGPTCTPTKPAVTATPTQSPSVQAGTAVLYTVSVKNNDIGPCTSASFGLQATAPSGWQGTFTVPSLTVAPGATGTTTLTVTSVPSPPGPYPIVGTATKTGTPSDTASASMTYTLAAPGGGTGTFSDDFNRPDAPTLGNGWTSTNWSIKADPQTSQQRARSVAAKPASSVAVAPLSGATQTVSADFTPIDLTGERFCLLLRWTATGGYMACRATGGSSLLRLIRVSGGVETILRAASLGNPAKGVPFTMTATISGNTFSMGVGATKVSPVNTATDLTPGSVGMRLDAGSAPTSHAADNFTATAQ